MSTNESMKQPSPKSQYTDEELDDLGFHDCYVWGMRWDAQTYSFSLDLDYIVEWVKPADRDGAFRFWTSKAELCFGNVDNLEISLSWDQCLLECQIQDIHRRESRNTPNGTTQWRWELELSSPEGEVSFWATDFQLRIVTSPVLSDGQSPRIPQS